MVCKRCGKEGRVSTMSYFDTSIICVKCFKKELRHPDYERARNAENEAVRNGIMNFRGIGLPADLRQQ